MSEDISEKIIAESEHWERAPRALEVYVNKMCASVFASQLLRMGMDLKKDNLETCVTVRANDEFTRIDMVLIANDGWQSGCKIFISDEAMFSKGSEVLITRKMLEAVRHICSTMVKHLEGSIHVVLCTKATEGQPRDRFCGLPSGHDGECNYTRSLRGDGSDSN